ncbi:MAG: cyclic nucleotide-binding domain-containing protein [Actinomycetes bacterium]
MDHPNAADLMQIPLLAGIPTEFRAELAQRLEVEDHNDGHAIVREGSSGYAFYLLASGTAVVTQEGHELRRLESGDYFGEISIMGEGRRTATVTAVGPVVVWVLFGTAFRVLQTSRPDVSAAIEAAMQQRLAGH